VGGTGARPFGELPSQPWRHRRTGEPRHPRQPATTPSYLRARPQQSRWQRWAEL